MNATAATTGRAEAQVRIDELGTLHAALARAFGEAGRGGAELETIFSQAIGAQCIGCGIRVTGTDLGRLAVTEGTVTEPDPRVDRLRLGYCARNGCNVRLYRLTCEPVSGLEVGGILQRALQLRYAPPPDAAPPPPPAPRPVWYRDRSRRLRMALVLLVVVVGVRVVWNRGLIPGLPKKPTYKADPASAREAL